MEAGRKASRQWAIELARVQTSAYPVACQTMKTAKFNWPMDPEATKALADAEADASHLFGCSLADAISLPIARSSSARNPRQDTVCVLSRFHLPFGIHLVASRRTAAPTNTSERWHFYRALRAWWATRVLPRIGGKERQSPQHPSANLPELSAAAQAAVAPESETLPSQAKMLDVGAACGDPSESPPPRIVNQPDRHGSNQCRRDAIKF